MDMWQCTECGAMFARVGPAEIYDGVTHCTKCVEVELLTTMVARLEAERDAARGEARRWERKFRELEARTNGGLR